LYVVKHFNFEKQAFCENRWMYVKNFFFKFGPTIGLFLMYFGILFSNSIQMFLQNTEHFLIHFIWHHFKVNKSNWVSLAIFSSFAFHLLLLIFFFILQCYIFTVLGLTESMWLSKEELMLWQRNPAWLDLSHWPSFIT
jgi:hypothetical protein